MKFKILDRILDIKNVEPIETELSPYTGREVQSFSICFDTVGESNNDIVQEKLSNYENGNIFSLDDDNIKVKEYKLINTSYTYSNNQNNKETVYRYTLDLKEIEKLNIESLTLGKIEVFPYDYEEEYIKEKEALTITAKIEVSEDTIAKLDKLREEKRYFEVIRNGISSDKLKMRFGQGLWSKNEEKIKQKLILVEENYDKVPTSMTFPHEPDVTNMKKMLAQAKNQNDELIKLLLSKNLISKEDVDKIKTESKINFGKTNRKFYEVDDLDKY
ncbi:MAG: hypothetical protein ACTHXX_12715 [Staphylococcus equorum]